jgi:hypothetical protein
MLINILIILNPHDNLNPHGELRKADEEKKE